MPHKKREPKKITAIEFKRTNKTNFKTRVTLTKIERKYHGKPPQGIIHKAVRFKKERMINAPSLKKVIWDRKPTTDSGKFVKRSAKNLYYIYNAAKKTALITLLSAETLLIQGSKIFAKAALNAISHGGDDVSRSIAAIKNHTQDIARTHRDLKNIKNIQQRAISQYKGYQYADSKTGETVKIGGSKNQYKSSRKDYTTISKTVTADIKLRRKKISNYRKDSKKYIHNSRKTVKPFTGTKRKAQRKNFKYNKNVNTVLKKRRTGIKKREIKRDKLKRKTSAKHLKYKQKIHKTSKKLYKQQKSAKTKYAIGRAADKLYGSAISKTDDNDITKAVDKGIRTAKVIHGTTAQKLHRKQRRITNLENKSGKSTSKFYKKDSKLQQKTSMYRTKHKRQKKKINNKKSKIAAFKANPIAVLGNSAKNVAGKFMWKIAIPVISIILILFSIAQFIIPLTGKFGDFVCSVLPVADSELTTAAERYRYDLWFMNDRILKITSDWQNQLSALGVNTTGYEEPTEYFWGYTAGKLEYTPKYDYNEYKLLAFLTAYLSDLDLDNDSVWTYNADTEALIDRLFDTEYEFKHFYEDLSYWEECNVNQYNTVTKDANKRITYVKTETYNETQYASFNESYYFTTVTATTYKTYEIIWYQCYYYDDDNGWTQCNYDTYNTTDKPTRRQVESTVEYNQSEYDNIPQGRWDYFSKDVTTTEYTIYTVEFYQPERYIEIRNLYYSVNQVMTFEQVIDKLLREKSDYTERKEYYDMLTGDLYGGHQTLEPILRKADGEIIALLELIDGGKILSYNGYDFNGWNVIPHYDNSHTGIDISANNGTTIYAPIDGIILETGNDYFILVSNKMSKYNADGKYFAQIIFRNAVTNYTEGSTVYKGTPIGYITSDRYCGEIGGNYLHISVWAQQNGTMVYIDPQLLFE